MRVFSTAAAILFCLCAAQTVFAASSPAVTRYAGQDRFETSCRISGAVDSIAESNCVVIANGMNFPDTLTGSVYSALARMPIMLVSNTLTNSAVEKSLSGENVRQAVVYGGQYAVSENTATCLFGGDPSAPAPYANGANVVAQKAAPYYAITNTKSRVLGNVDNGSTLNVVQTIYDSEHYAWYPFQLNGDKRVWLRRRDILEKYLERKGTAKNNTPLYASAAKDAPVVGSLSEGTVYALLEEATGSDGGTWFKVILGGREGWTSRMNFDITNIYHAIPDKNFSGKIPVVYLSPSCQYDNEYITGGTNEQREMEAVAKIVKQILNKEYNCRTFIATPKLDIHRRPDEALDRGADIYIAIHSNATGSSAVLHGSNVYIFPTCDQGDILAQNIVSELDMIAPAKPNFSPRITEGMSVFDNIGYAEIREPSNYGMISVLAETEFHDNAVGSNWIISHHNEIARAYVNAIVKTFGITRR